VILPVPLRSPLLLDQTRAEGLLDDVFGIELLYVVSVWFAVEVETFHEARSPFQDLSTKDADVNVEEADLVFRRLIRAGEWIDCLDGDGWPGQSLPPLARPEFRSASKYRLVTFLRPSPESRIDDRPGAFVIVIGSVEIIPRGGVPVVEQPRFPR